MDLDVMTVALALAGTVMLYGAIKNKNPIGLVKAVLSGQSPETAPPLVTSGPGINPSTPGSVGGPPVPGQDPNAAPDPIPGLPNGPVPYAGGFI